MVEFLLVKFDLSKDIFWVDITSIFAELLLCPAWLSTFFSNWAWCPNHEKSEFLFAYDAANIPTWNVKRWLLCNLGNYFQILYSAERWEPKINCTVFWLNGYLVLVVTYECCNSWRTLFTRPACERQSLHTEPHHLTLPDRPVRWFSCSLSERANHFRRIDSTLGYKRRWRGKRRKARSKLFLKARLQSLRFLSRMQ